MTTSPGPRSESIADEEPAATILVAEDDIELRRLMARALRGDGFRVIEARDGEELVDHLCLSRTLARSWPRPDLVITDIRMAKTDGLEALSLFGQPDDPPFIVITAFGSSDTHQRAWLLGAAAVLDKPLDLDELRAEVTRQLDRLR